MEARLGCSSTLLGPDKLDQFLKYDRKVRGGARCAVAHEAGGRGGGVTCAMSHS